MLLPRGRHWPPHRFLLTFTFLEPAHTWDTAAARLVPAPLSSIVELRDFNFGGIYEMQYRACRPLTRRREDSDEFVSQCAPD
jgi:hypothetical protein